MEFFWLLLPGLAIMVTLMVILFFVQRATGDAGVVDVGWPGGIGLMVLIFAFYAEGEPWRVWTVTALGLIWSTRLTLYILFNRVIGKEEDGRYKMLREHYGDRAQFFFFWFYQLQGVVAVVFTLPFLILQNNSTPEMHIIEWAGIQIWILAIIGEAMADWQLAQHRKDPANKGKTCRRGLWKYSRHPNYFFEWLHWWSYVVMALPFQYGIITLVPATMMHYFLFRVTGIPYTEKQALKSRSDYEEYIQTTSQFIPWWPKR